MIAMKAAVIAVAVASLAAASCAKKDGGKANQDKPPEQVASGAPAADAAAPTDPATATEKGSANPMGDYEAAINKQYGKDDLSQSILDALKAAGKDINKLTRDDIATFSEFHTMGKPATLDLAEL